MLMRIWALPSFRLIESAAFFFLTTAIFSSQSDAQEAVVTPIALLQLATRSEISTIALSSDSKHLVAGDTDGNVFLCTLTDRSCVRVQFDRRILFASFFDRDNSFLLVDTRGSVHHVDKQSLNRRIVYETSAKPAIVAMDSRRRSLAIVTSDEIIEIVDLGTFASFGFVNGEDKLDDVLYLGFDRLGTQILTAMELGNLVSWNPITKKLLRELSLYGELSGSSTVIRSVSSNQSSNVFVIGLEEAALPKGGIKTGKDLERRYSISVFDWSTGIEIKRIQCSSRIKRIALGPGSDRAIVISDESRDRGAEILDLRKGEALQRIPIRMDPATIAFSDDNAVLAFGGDAGAVSVWRAGSTYDSLSLPPLPSISGRVRITSSSEPLIRRGEKTRLAILSFDAEGVSQTVGNVSLTSLSSWLSNLDYIVLTERKKIEAILKEQRFRLSSLTEETGIRVGKLLNVDNVVLGSVGKLGRSYVFTAQVISVETARILGSREVLCDECSDQDFFDAMKALGASIAR
jgi:WD40 repeat protein